MLVHAHPDDETINNGATMARYVAEGAHVTLITCTLADSPGARMARSARRVIDHEGDL